MNGQPVADPKLVHALAPGDVIDIGIFARVTGANATLTDDQMGDATGSIRSTGPLLGTLTAINFFYRTLANGSNQLNGINWREDGVPALTLTHPHTTGAPVVIVPEPAATAGLAAVASLGLLARRRNKE